MRLNRLKTGAAIFLGAAISLGATTSSQPIVDLPPIEGTCRDDGSGIPVGIPEEVARPLCGD